MITDIEKNVKDCIDSHIDSGMTNNPTPHRVGHVNYEHQWSYGWVCPKCGAVMAPHLNECIHCKPGKSTITFYKPNKKSVITTQGDTQCGIPDCMVVTPYDNIIKPYSKGE